MPVVELVAATGSATREGDNAVVVGKSDGIVVPDVSATVKIAVGSLDGDGDDDDDGVGDGDDDGDGDRDDNGDRK